jgi:hypothetical protein
MRWTTRVETVNHYINSTKGIDSTYWKVHAVKKKNVCVNTLSHSVPSFLARYIPPTRIAVLILVLRFYSLIMIAAEVNSTGFPDFNAFTYTTTNRFLIHGGPKLRPEEIDGVVVGSIVTLALIIGAFVGVTLYIRERRSCAAAVQVSENTEERYADAS